jgi:hypothetical protein
MDPQNPSLPFPGLGFVVGLQIYASMRERGMGWLRGSDRLASGDRRRRWRADMETVAGGNGEVGTGTGTGTGTVREDELVSGEKAQGGFYKNAAAQLISGRRE